MYSSRMDTHIHNLGSNVADTRQVRPACHNGTRQCDGNRTLETSRAPRNPHGRATASEFQDRIQARMESMGQSIFLRVADPTVDYSPGRSAHDAGHGVRSDSGQHIGKPRCRRFRKSARMVRMYTRSHPTCVVHLVYDSQLAGDSPRCLSLRFAESRCRRRSLTKTPNHISGGTPLRRHAQLPYTCLVPRTCTPVSRKQDTILPGRIFSTPLQTNPVPSPQEDSASFSTVGRIKKTKRDLKKRYGNLHKEKTYL